MRKLMTKDVFKALAVINSAGLKDDLKAIMDKVQGNKLSYSDIGYEVLFNIMEKAASTKTEAAIYEFLAGPLEMEPEEVENMELLTVIQQLKECADMENWKGFFKSVSVLGTK